MAYAEDIQAELGTLDEATGLQPSATIDAALGRSLPGEIGAKKSALPMVVSICCTLGMSHYYLRRAEPATGWWLA